MILGEWLRRPSRPTHQESNSRFFGIPVADGSDNITNGIIVRRTFQDGDHRIFRRYQVSFVSQRLVDVGARHLEPVIRETTLIENGEFFSPRDAQRFGKREMRALNRARS